MREQHVEEATRAEARVALVTCAALRDLDEDNRLLTGPLAERGVRADAVAWDDPAADWAAYDLVVVRSPWDYAPRRDEFVAWAARVPALALAPPPDVIVWNTDKRYLRDLAAAGVPVVPTTWVAPGESWTAPGSGEHVVKPAISAGSRDTGRYDLADRDHRVLAEAHVARLGAAGRLALVQPYLPAVDTYGETALLFCDGPGGAGGPASVGGRAGLRFSHAIRKGPMLIGPDVGETEAEIMQREHITPRIPTAAERAVARRALAAVPGGPRRLVYARVDLIPGTNGEPLVVELELTDPSLFLDCEAGAAERFAAAIAARVPG